MSMDDNDRNEVIKLQAERAQNIIKEIDILIENRLWATTANRLYYALFHAACALLIKDEHAVKSHQGVNMALGQFYVKNGMLTPNDGKFYGRMQGLREKSDYNCMIQITEDEVKSLVEPTKELVGKLLLLAAS